MIAKGKPQAIGGGGQRKAESAGGGRCEKKETPVKKIMKEELGKPQAKGGGGKRKAESAGGGGEKKEAPVKKMMKEELSTAQELDKLADNCIDAWLASVFEESDPVQYLVAGPLSRNNDRDDDGPRVILGTSEDHGCIIDNPELTMNIPFVSADIDKAKNDILAACAEKNTATRAKPVVVITRGMGSGKTRMMEECRRCFVASTNDVVPLAITFNNKTPLPMVSGRSSQNANPASDDDWGPEVDAYCSYALSVTARMASSFFGIKFSTCVTMLKARLAEILPLMKTAENVVSRVIIVSFVKLVFSKMELAGSSANKLVVMMDEVQKAEQHFMKVYGTSQITSAFTQALLGDDIPTTVNVAVVLSMADITPSGTTKGSSFRSIATLELPEALDVDLIVDQCWELKDVSDSDTGKHALKLFAATLNKTPRLVEIARNFIVDARSEIDAQFIGDLLKHVSTAVNQRYGTPRLKSTSTTAAAIFGDYTVDVSDEVMNAVTFSVLSNQIKFTAEQGPPTVSSLIPATSLFMLKTAASNGPLESLSPQLLSCFDRIFECITSVSARKEGDLLELIYREWLQVRLETVRVAAWEGIKLGDSMMSAARLLGLGRFRRWSSLEDDAQKVFTRPLPVNKETGPILHTELVYCSRDIDQPAGCFLKELEGVKVTANNPVAVILPWGIPPPGSTREEEAWDLCLKIRYPIENGEAEPRILYVFIDNKAREELPKSPLNDTTIKHPTIERLPRNGSQYMHTKKVMGEEHQDFLYVYATTNNVVTYSLDGRALVMGRADTFAMLGPLAELSKAGRCQFNLQQPGKGGAQAK